MKNFYHLIFSLFIVSILTLCGCTVDSANGQPSANLETPKSLALGNLGHDSDMVLVEGGTFQMWGTSKTVSSFYMCKYEVTQAEYQKIMGSNPSYFEGDKLPVESVSWYEAVNYCNKRSEKEGFTPCYTINGNDVTCNWNANGYRLPTEAEWEYAARGGSHKSTFEYSGSKDIDSVAWYFDNSDNETHEVGKKQENALGLYDMSGNVNEWCWDWYGNSAEKDPAGPASGSGRVFRGGGWGNGADDCRCAFRDFSGPGCKCNYRGFRVVRSGGAIVPKNMVYVEGGTFQMGCDTSAYNYERPAHQVTVSGFYMSKYEVTQAEYAAVMGTNPSNFKGDQRPVEQVTWYDAVNYCNRRSEAEKLTPCYTINGNNVTCNWNANGYRLPTEAEWEYAARGGIHKSTFEYSGSDNIDEIAWYTGNSGNQTHEVGTKKANALGLYDMSGNVWEWCWDWSGNYNNGPETDALGPASGGIRVIRGGGWDSNAADCRCAYRRYYSPSDRSYGLGFRVVCSCK